ncbi:MAG TPA: hypothetical protein VKR06_33985 [Ktedonosporobacter sp.]|nr:hypothetical protein [Ktedonosporobacter sp.]
MALRVKFFLTCAALVLVLFCTIYTARVTTADWQNFQRQTALVKAKDVHTIRSWMSITYIARTYHVPESYLIQSLRLPDPKNPRLSHETLVTLASYTKRPVDELIRQTQNAIISYHKQHPGSVNGSGGPPPVGTVFSESAVGREAL